MEQKRSIGHTKEYRTDPRSVEKWNGCELDDDRQVVGVSHPAVGTFADYLGIWQDDDPRIPEGAKTRYRPVAEGHGQYQQTAHARSKGDRPGSLEEQDLCEAGREDGGVKHHHHGIVAGTVFFSTLVYDGASVSFTDEQLDDSLCSDQDQ